MVWLSQATVTPGHLASIGRLVRPWRQPCLIENAQPAAHQWTMAAAASTTRKRRQNGRVEPEAAGVFAHATIMISSRTSNSRRRAGIAAFQLDEAGLAAARAIARGRAFRGIHRQQAADIG